MEKGYTDKELEDSLRKAFVDKKFPSILFDGHVAINDFLRNGIEYGVKQGWLEEERTIEETQYTAINYQLTEKGREYFGVRQKAS